MSGIVAEFLGAGGNQVMVPADLVDPWLEIDSGALGWNLTQIGNRVGDRPVMAVVKCNAYGHGAVEVARVLKQDGVNQFAVVKVGEALALRDSVGGSILNMGSFSAQEVEVLVGEGISQSVYTGAVDLLAEAARRVDISARVHIKIDTGMSRVGVPFSSAVEFIHRVGRMPEIEIEGVFTTLTEEPDFDLVQIERLHQVCSDARGAGLPIGVMHAASSAAVAERPAAYLDVVRPGSAIVGLEPLPNLDLRPTMTFKARVTLVKRLRPGNTIGYHRVGKVDQEMTLATIPVGYADGYPPQVADKADVLIKGRRWPAISYISANHTLVDVTGSDVREGDEAVLVGSQGDNTITLGELATHSGRSVYQLATGMNPLLPRIVT